MSSGAFARLARSVADAATRLAGRRAVARVVWALMWGQRVANDPRGRIAARIVVVALNVSILVFALNGTMLLSARRLDADRAWVKHTWEVLIAIRVVLQDLVDAESAQRAYLISGDNIYVSEYRVAKARSVRDIDRLAILTADNRRQRARIEHARSLVAAKFRFLDQFVIRRAWEGHPRESIDLDVGRHLIGEIRATFDAMDDDERALFNARDVELTRTVYRIYVGLFVVLASEVLVLAVFAWTLVRAVRARREAGRTGGDRR